MSLARWRRCSRRRWRWWRAKCSTSDRRARTIRSSNWWSSSARTRPRRPWSSCTRRRIRATIACRSRRSSARCDSTRHGPCGMASRRSGIWCGPGSSRMCMMSVIATDAARVLARPIAPAVPLCEPAIRGNAWQYVKDCLDTGWVSSVGAYVDRFEREMAEVAGTAYAVATTNGTAALHAALLVAGVRPDDEVLVSTLTFIAPVNAIRYAGAWPVFIDAEPTYWQMDPSRVLDFVEHQCEWSNGELRNRKTGRRVSAIIPVHILGHPVDIEPILTIARKYNLKVVEDSTEALGSTYRGKSPGSFGDVGCFSFNGNKIITTGGGGMIVTDREDWAKKAKYLTTQAKDDPIEYIHGEVGYNYRLVNVLAAIGCAQMEQLASYVEKKRAI